MPRFFAQVEVSILAGALAVGCGFLGAKQARDPFQVFSEQQWRDLASTERSDGSAFGKLRSEGFGLEGQPGFIPYDLALLDRVTFVGIPVWRLENVLGPNGRPWIPNQPYGETGYEMFPDPDRCYRIILEFKFEANSDFVPVVVSERLNRFYQCTD